MGNSAGMKWVRIRCELGVLEENRVSKWAAMSADMFEILSVSPPRD